MEHSHNLANSVPSLPERLRRRSTGEIFSAVVFALALFPYVTAGPLAFPSEVQPWAALFAWLAILYALATKGLKLEKFHLFFLGFGALFLVYVPLMDEINIQSFLRVSGAFILCSSIVVLMQYMTPERMISLLKFASVVWFAFALLGQISPGTYLEVVRPFVPRALGAFGERGVTSLAPEATDFGFTMAYLCGFAFLATLAMQSKGKSGPPRWVFIVIVLSILLSRSASGIFAISIVYVFWRLLYKPERLSYSGLTRALLLVAVIVPLLALFVAAAPATGVRGIDMMILTLTSPEELTNTTLSYRLAHNLVGIFGLLDSYLMGWGAGSFVRHGVDIYIKYDIASLIDVQGWYMENIPNTLRDKPMAVFPVIVFEYGIFGLIYVFGLFRYIIRSNVQGTMMIMALLLMAWAQSFPVAYPLFWALLGLVRNPHFLVQPRQAQSTTTQAVQQRA